MATKIYIDQGHNPKNPNAGSEGNGYREQDIVYDIGVRLASLLKSRGFETKLSRKSEDSQLGNSTLTSLKARVDEANLWGADYFISLHTNASSNSSANGSEALVFALPSEAGRLAFYILEQLSLTTNLRVRGVIPRPKLYVLRKTKMPAVLVELGFITNPAEANLMANSPELFALGVANGVSDYMRSLVDAFANMESQSENSKKSRLKLFKGLYGGGVEQKTSQNGYIKKLKNRRRSQGRTYFSDSEEDIFESDAIEEIGEINSEVSPENNPDESPETTIKARKDRYENMSYEDFLRINSMTGLLRIQAYRARKAYPVEKVKITIYRNFSDGEKVFYSGETDSNGIIDDIVLPAPPMLNSMEFDSMDKNSVFGMKAQIDGFEQIERDVEIFEGVKTIQPLLMTEIWEG